MAIAIIFDISERIDDFIEKDAPLRAIIFEYYLNFVLFYSNLFSALLIFISVIFFTAKMAQDTEIVAILSGGVSFKRLLLPYFIASTFLVVCSLGLNHWLIPEANKIRLNFEEVYIRNKFYNSERDIHKEISPGQFVYFEQFRTDWNKGFKFSLEQWDNTKMIDKITAKQIIWDSTRQKWVLSDYVWRKINGTDETIIIGASMDTTLNIHPEDFAERLNFVEAMNTNELDKYIAKEIQEGSIYVPYYEIEKHSRTAYPLATYILTLIGVSISSRKVRGGIGLHIAFGLLICGIYILCMKVTSVFATNAGLDAFIAVWIPNIIFGIIGLYMFYKAPK